MASPRSMWSGTISLGLLNVPVTIGKSYADERVESLRDVCSCHGQPIDRTERCSVTSQPPEGKAKGVQVGDEWRVIKDAEWASIEAATKSDTLLIEDVQPVYEYPIEYGKGTYYVRADKKAKGAGLAAFATFVEALRDPDRGAFVMWCRSAKQDPSVLHVTSDGMLLLTVLPTRSEWREPGDQEKAHIGMQTDPKMVEMMGQLFDTVASNGFVWGMHANKGVELRNAAVEKIVGGEQLQQKEPKDNGQNVPDLMATLQASMQEVKTTTKAKTR